VSFLFTVHDSFMASPTYEEARARKVAAEAQIAELELAKVQGELVIAEDVVSAWSDTLSSLKAKIISIPSKAAPIVASEDSAGGCQKVLDELIREALEELSNYDPKIDAANTQGTSTALEESADSSEASPAPKRKRVGRPRKTAGLAK
jgi:phage terminase Nu1 subunit (DNA packaging protein)